MKREDVLETTRRNMMFNVDRRDVINAKGKPLSPGIMLLMLEDQYSGWRKIKDLEQEVESIIVKSMKQHKLAP